MNLNGSIFFPDGKPVVGQMLLLKKILPNPEAPYRATVLSVWQTAADEARIAIELEDGTIQNDVPAWWHGGNDAKRNQEVVNVDYRQS